MHGGAEKKRSAQRALLALAACALLLTSCSPDEAPRAAGGPAASMARLHTEGTRLVNERGETVVLRGVNLGSWLFHETWISCVDYPRHGRIHAIGQQMGISQDVDAALRSVGPDSGQGWLAAFRADLEARVGAPRAEELLEELARYPSVFDDSDLPLRRLLEDRFGTEGRDELLDVFWGAWVREADVAWIASQGFNVVRVPMGYRNLITGSDREPLTELSWNERAFARLDALLAWCEAHGVYAVMDIQEAPGGQNDYSGPARLYEDPRMQALTLDLWAELSRRYGDRSVVAAYSLLAEPFGAPSTAARDDMYDRLIRRIRDRGDDHPLVIHDGFFGLWTLPDPAARGWEGVIYSTHLFEFGAASLPVYRLLAALYDGLFNAAQARQNVPYYIGSFSTMADAHYAYQAAELLVDLYERSGWSWSLWTYKRIDDPVEAELFGTSTSWGLRGRLGSAFERPDAHLDGREVLRGKFAAYADLVLDPNERLLGIVTSRPAACR